MTLSIDTRDGLVKGIEHYLQGEASGIQNEQLPTIQTVLDLHMTLN